jgi:hypothetical protein
MASSRNSNACPTLNCDKLISPSSRMFYCSNCRQMMGNWSKRPKGDIIRRGEALDKWRDRIQNLRQRREQREKAVK